VLESGYGSFEEYRDCADRFFENGSLDLAEQSIVEAIQSFSGRPGDWSFKYTELVAAFLQSSVGRVDIDSDLKTSLKLLAEALESSEDSLERFAQLMNINPSLQTPSEMKDMAERVATAIMLIHDGGDFGLVRVASFFRRGFTEWNPSKDNSQRGKQETIKLGRSILNGILARNKGDLVARTVRASIHADLGNLTDATEDIEYVFAAEKPSKFASLAGSRIFYLDGAGYRAWDVALPVFEEHKEPAVYGMLVIAYAVAKANDIESQQLHAMRAYLDSCAGFVSKDKTDWRGRQILEKNIALNLMIRDNLFGYAYVYLSELQRENWGGSTEHWAAKLRKAAIAQSRDPQVEGLRLNPKLIDMFPDWRSSPQNTSK
jgi:hypothetical protein